MSVGSEFTSDAATGKEHRPTVVSQNGGTSTMVTQQMELRV